MTLALLQEENLKAHAEVLRHVAVAGRPLRLDVGAVEGLLEVAQQSGEIAAEPAHCLGLAGVARLRDAATGPPRLA